MRQLAERSKLKGLIRQGSEHTAWGVLGWFSLVITGEATDVGNVVLLDRCCSLGLQVLSTENKTVKSNAWALSIQ